MHSSIPHVREDRLSSETFPEKGYPLGPALNRQPADGKLLDDSACSADRHNTLVCCSAENQAGKGATTQ